MTSLALAARNYLAEKSDLTALLGSNGLFPTWIFVDSPEENIETTGKAMVVISVLDGWAGANEHNTARFPRLTVDIWVDPTRNPDGSVRKKDAKIRAEAIYKVIDKYLHLVSKSLPDGSSIFWGTPAQIADKTGTRVVSSVRDGEPSYSPAFDDQGAYMATLRYNVTV